MFVGAALLSACVSTQMRGFVGKDITEAQFRYGQPVNVIDLADGRRAFQFAQGGGSSVVPGQSVAVAQSQGDTTFIAGQSTPAMVVERAPCLLTFIAGRSGQSWVVQEIRAPKELIC